MIIVFIKNTRIQSPLSYAYKEQCQSQSSALRKQSCQLLFQQHRKMLHYLFTRIFLRY